MGLHCCTNLVPPCCLTSTAVAWTRCPQETAGLGRSIKAVKAREQQLRLEGMTGGKAGKVAASLVTGVKRKKQKKSKVRRLGWVVEGRGWDLHTCGRLAGAAH